MSLSYWLDQSKSETVTKDIVIIGGGIAGMSSAYWLQKSDPTLEIAVVEKYELGSGATGRNAGFITCGSVEHFNRLVGKHGKKEALDIWNFSEDNLKFLKEEIIQDNVENLLFEHRGSFSLAGAESEFKELQESAALMKDLGVNVEVLNETDIKSRTGGEGFVGGVKYLDDASIHPIKLLHHMKVRIEENGKNVNFYENNEVHRIETRGDYQIIHTSKYKFEAPIVVFATNGYSPLLNDFFSDKIFPTRGQILATEAVPRFMEAPCYANFVLDYFRQLPTGQVVIGGFRQLQKDVEKGYSDETSNVIQEALEKFLRDHVPAVRQAKITHRWSGIMGFSIDGQPMVGALPTDHQLYFVGGFTAHGIGLAFHSGKALAESLFEVNPIPAWLSAKRLQ
jgi:glycine/D-amino acid oxidase-like deaminating enzyme